MFPSISLKNIGDEPIVPIADLVVSSKYSTEETVCRNQLASLCRLIDIYEWSQLTGNSITHRIPGKPDEFLTEPEGLLYREISASVFLKLTNDGTVLDPGPTNLDFFQPGYAFHSAVYKKRPDINCIIHLHTSSIMTISATKFGLLPICQEALIVGPVSYMEYMDEEDEIEIPCDFMELDKKVIFLRNHGMLACGTTVQEALHFAYHTMIAAETQIRAFACGIENIILPSEEAIKKTFELSRHGASDVNRVVVNKEGHFGVEKNQDIENRTVGAGAFDWEALMHILDQAGYKTGHNYKRLHPKEPSNKD